MRGFGLTGAARVVRLLVSDDLPDLLLGSRCVGCDRPGRALCSVCGMGLAGPARPTAPTPAPPGLPPVWATAGYGGVVRAALIAHKERGRVTLAAPLGAALALAIEAGATATAPPDGATATPGIAAALTTTDATAAPGGRGVTGADAASSVNPSGVAGAVGATRTVTRASTDEELLVVPVPSAGRAVRERGYDPMLAIARQAVRQLRRSGHRARLVRPVRLNRRVADQTELGAADRMANLAGAFSVPKRHRSTIAGRTVVLVDDLMTTGATLHAVAAALRSAGARVTAAAVVAATPRDSGT
ncbi:ComF family protein [Flindersiella endophytica]